MNQAPSKRGRSRTRKQVPPIRALERGCAVLEAVGEAGSASLSEIARATGLSVSTTFRVLETLRQCGYVEQVAATGMHHLGFRAAQIGAKYADNSPLPRAAHMAMQKLVGVVNETANLAVLDNGEVVYIHQVEAQQGIIRMFTHLGARAPLHCTGVGKILLAWRHDEDARQLLERRPLVSYTPSTITSIEKFMEELAIVRQQGFAVDDEEREPGVRCVTAPVRGADGSVAAAISVSGPTTRFQKGLVEPWSQHVKEAALEISRRLGYEPPNDLPASAAS